MSGASRRGFRVPRLALPLGVFVCGVGIVFALATLPFAPRQQLDLKIRWDDRLTDAEKTNAALELGLTLVRLRDDGVWIVRAADPSPQAVKRLVTDPRIADTDDVDRRLYTLRYRPQTFPQWISGRYPAVPRLIQRVTDPALYIPVSVAVPLLALVVAGAYPAVTRSRPWIFRGVPTMSGPALALFRVAYGVAMLLALRSIFEEALAPSRGMSGWWAQTALIDAVRANPQNVVRLLEAAVASLVLFCLGLAPRVSLVVATACVMCVDGLLLGRRSIHDWGLPTMAMLLMVLVPWQHGFGVTAALRRWRGRPEPSSSLPPGLALWIPAFAVGVAFLAAAYAKLQISGLAWITSGAVRYHFIDDSANAPVDWGMRIATSDSLSVAFSLGALAVEATVWIVIWFASWRVRLALGVVAASLLAGFYLFQGVFWPAWWTLLLAFLPWQQAVDALSRRLPRFTVLVDGECPVCRRTARALHSLDWFDRLTFSDAADELALSRVAPGLPRNTALGEMHVIDANGQRAAGFDAYLQLARSLPPLWIARAAGLIPPVREAGHRLYRRFASTRRRDGRCTDAVCDSRSAPLPRPANAAGVAAAIPFLLPIVFAAVLMQQIVVSALAVESLPFISNFPMYSHTYATRADFDEHLRGKPAYELATAALRPGELDDRLAEFCDLDEVLYPAIEGAIGQSIAPRVREEVRTVLRRYEEKYRTPLGPLSVVRRERRFDWQRGEFDRSPRVTFEGTVDLARVAAGG